jgi:hypothetical protein
MPVERSLSSRDRQAQRTASSGRRRRRFPASFHISRSGMKPRRVLSSSIWSGFSVPISITLKPTVTFVGRLRIRSLSSAMPGAIEPSIVPTSFSSSPTLAGIPRIFRVALNGGIERLPVSGPERLASVTALMLSGNRARTARDGTHAPRFLAIGRWGGVRAGAARGVMSERPQLARRLGETERCGRPSPQSLATCPGNSRRSVRLD